MNKRSIAEIIAYNKDGEVVFDDNIPLDDYWDSTNEIIDSDTFRSKKEVTRVTGKLYSSNGKVIQEFENIYSKKGEYLSGWAKHEDGTITKD